MRRLLFLFLLLPLTCFSQLALVNLRFTSEGQVEVEHPPVRVTLPFAALPVLTDTVFTHRWFVNEKGKRNNETKTTGFSSRFNFSLIDQRKQLEGLSVYPDDNRYNEKTWTSLGKHKWRLECSGSYFEGCGNGGYYAFYHYYQTWQLDRNGRVKTIETGAVVYDTVKHREKDVYHGSWNYSYEDDGRISTIVIRDAKNKVAATYEWRYDAQKHLVASFCWYNEIRRPSDQQLAAWRSELETHIRKRDDVQYLFLDRQISVLNFYTWENDRLRSTLGYAEQWSTPFRDSLDYDAAGRLTRLRNFNVMGDWEETKLQYDTSTGKLGSHRLYYHSGCANRGCDEWEQIENFEFDAAGRVTEIQWDYRSRTGSEQQVERFRYAGN